MIANELNRAKSWLIKNDHEEVTNCYERAFELLDLTVSIVKKENLLREMLRLREVIGNEYVKKKRDLRTTETILKVLISLDSESYNLLNKKV
ncbi:MAG: hypothetical protein ACK41Q_13765 [Candidatus Brocadia sp.]